MVLIISQELALREHEGLTYGVKLNSIVFLGPRISVHAHCSEGPLADVSNIDEVVITLGDLIR